MRKLILKMNMSLDGFVGGVKGEIDWIFKNSSDDSKKWILDTISQAGLHIMGSRTYADMAAYWPSSTDVLAAPTNAIPKMVFSRTGIANAKTSRALEDASRLEPIAKSDASWGTPRVASGDLASEIARLKAEPGQEIIAHGGASFARSLIATGLIDEYQLVVHPVALGRGLALFADLPKPMPLALVSSAKFAGGTVANVLRPA